MPKRLTIEQIKDFLKENDTNNSCELLSEEYVNNSTPLKFKCNLCGEIFYRDYQHLKRGRFKCQTCANKDNIPKNKLSIETVKEYLEKNDINHQCELLSTEYKSASDKLEFRCNICGNIFFRDFNHIKRGRFCCDTCGILKGAKHCKYSKEDVSNKIAESGYIIIGEYINANTPCLVKCQNGHEFNLIFSQYLCHHSGCKKCAILNHTGENHPNWKGGESEVIDILRKSLKEWKKQVLIRDEFKCQISGEKKDIVIHHIYGFNLILLQASKNINVPILRQVSDYSNIEDFYLLQKEVQKLHKIGDGITLSREIHNKFHSLYGKGDNTPEQFEEFLSLFYNKQ